MINMRPMIATCDGEPEYEISVESHSDFITISQKDDGCLRVIEIASADQADDLITILRASMLLNGWDV